MRFAQESFQISALRSRVRTSGEFHVMWHSYIVILISFKSCLTRLSSSDFVKSCLTRLIFSDPVDFCLTRLTSV